MSIFLFCFKLIKKIQEIIDNLQLVKLRTEAGIDLDCQEIVYLIE